MPLFPSSLHLLGKTQALQTHRQRPKPPPQALFVHSLSLMWLHPCAVFVIQASLVVAAQTPLGMAVAGDSTEKLLL